MLNFHITLFPQKKVYDPLRDEADSRLSNLSYLAGLLNGGGGGKATPTPSGVVGVPATNKAMTGKGKVREASAIRKVRQVKFEDGGPIGSPAPSLNFQVGGALFSYTSIL